MHDTPKTVRFMKTFARYVTQREQNERDDMAYEPSDEQKDAINRAIELAFDRYPSETKDFFRELEDPDIDELMEDIEKEPSLDPAKRMFKGKPEEDKDEVMPPEADGGESGYEED